MDRPIKVEEGPNSVKSELDDKTEVDRNLSVVSSPAKRRHVKDEDNKADSTPKRQKLEDNSDELDVKQEDIEDAKNTNQASLSYKSEKIPDIKLEDTAEVNIKSEDALTPKPACKDDYKMVDIKLEFLLDLPNEGSPYIRKREMGIKVEVLQDTIVQCIEAGHLGIKAKEFPFLKAKSGDDIYNDSTRGSKAKSYTTPESDFIFHRIRWQESATQSRIIASPSRSPLALSSPAESPTPSRGRPSPRPTPDFSTLRSPEPDPDPSDESNSSDSDSDGYHADISERSSSWNSDSDDSNYSPGSDVSDSDSDSSDNSSTSPSTRSSTTDATSTSPPPASAPYISPFTAPNLFYRDFYPTPVARNPGAAGPKIRFYRKNFFNKPSMIPSSCF